MQVSKHRINLQGDMYILLKVLIILVFLLTTPIISHAGWINKTAQITLAYGTNLLVHESGHYLYAKYYDMDPSWQFISKHDGEIFIGYTTVNDIPDARQLGFGAAGEIASSTLFELALNSYRKEPTTYNKSLIYITNYYFLIYTIYAFSFHDDNIGNDPVRIRKALNINELEFLSLIVLKVLFNQKRISSKSNWNLYISNSHDNEGLIYGFRYTL